MQGIQLSQLLCLLLFPTIIITLIFIAGWLDAKSYVYTAVCLSMSLSWPHQCNYIFVKKFILSALMCSNNIIYFLFRNMHQQKSIMTQNATVLLADESVVDVWPSVTSSPSMTPCGNIKWMVHCIHGTRVTIIMSNLMTPPSNLMHSKNMKVVTT